MEIKQHPGTGLWVTSDGRVILPPCRKYPRFRFTFGYKDTHGYMMVKYHGKMYQVHRLIAQTFIHNPNPEEYMEIDHINRVKTANFVSNLRWVDRKTQLRNQQRVDDSLEKYGVRWCDNPAEYERARRARNPERERAKQCKYRAKQRALGKHYRRCPDGSRQWLTDEEFDRLYKE